MPRSMKCPEERGTVPLKTDILTLSLFSTAVKLGAVSLLRSIWKIFVFDICLGCIYVMHAKVKPDI